MVAALNAGLLSPELVGRIRSDYFVRGIVYGVRELPDPTLLLLEAP